MTATIPFCDLGRESRALENELTDAAIRVIRSGRFLYGPELEAFEHEIADWHGVRYAVGVASGTDAVEIGLRTQGWKFAPSITVSAMTAPPSINAVEAAGYRPILVDPDPVTRNAEANLAVHLYGLADDVSDRYCAVEDIAHAMGATANGKLAGTMAKCGAVSFYPSKTLGALGDGGAIITNDPMIAARAKKIRHYGFDDTYEIVERGQNSRLSEIQAAWLRVKLPRVREWIDRRREIAHVYMDELAGRVVLPAEPPGHNPVYHVFVIQHPDRDRIASGLRDRGIGTAIHYPKAIHEYERWRALGMPGEFPVSEQIAREALSLPCYPFLRAHEQETVIAAIKELT